MTSGRTPSWTIAEAAALLGIQPDTLRYFERREIVPRPHRDASGRRTYSESDIHLLEVLQHLRNTGMPLANIAAFTRLVSRDPDGVRERLALLQRHRESVIRQKEQLAQSLLVIDQKIRDYALRIENPSEGTANEL